MTRKKTTTRPEKVPWTDAKNTRRCDLIDKEFNHGLTPAEAQELAALQEEVCREQRKIMEPLLKDARLLHRKLLAKARAAEKKAKK